MVRSVSVSLSDIGSFYKPIADSDSDCDPDPDTAESVRGPSRPPTEVAQVMPLDITVYGQNKIESKSYV